MVAPTGICGYGCGQRALYLIAKSKKGCCSPHPRGCPAYKLVMAEQTRLQMDAQTGMTSEQRQQRSDEKRKARQTALREKRAAETPPEGQLCEKGCGQLAKYHIGHLEKTPTGRVLRWHWCCSSHYRRCPAANAEARKKQKATTLERYGVESHQQSPKFIESYTRTCRERYGVDFATQTEEVKEKRKNTNLSIYGNAGAMSSEVLERRARTVRERYGVDNVAQAEHVKMKILRTFLKNYGMHPMKRKDYRERMHLSALGSQSQRESTNLQRYGSKSPSQSPVCKAKSVRTSLARYGVSHYRQHGPTFRRILINMYISKTYILPSGRVIKLQGYEPDAVNQLLCTRSEAELDFDNIPSIPYADTDGHKRVYYPDIFVPKENLIIEVKSWWTLKRNLGINCCKQEAVTSSGYHFQLWVKDPKDSTFTIISKPLSDLIFL